MVEVTRMMGDRTQLRRNPSLRRLADFYFGHGRLSEAEPLYLEAIDQARKEAAQEPRLLEATLSEYGEFLYRQDRHREAETVYRELVTLKSARLAPGDEDRLTFVASLGRVLTDLSWREHTNSITGAVTRLTPKGLPSTKTESQSLLVPVVAGQPPVAAAKPRPPAKLAHEAEKLLRQVMEAREAITNLMRWRVADGASRLGGALVAVAATDSTLGADARLAKLAEAETLLLNANGTLQQSKSAESKYKRDSLVRVERLYQAWPNPEKAAAARRNLEAFDKVRAERKAVKEAAP